MFGFISGPQVWRNLIFLSPSWLLPSKGPVPLQFPHTATPFLTWLSRADVAKASNKDEQRSPRRHLGFTSDGPLHQTPHKRPSPLFFFSAPQKLTHVQPVTGASLFDELGAGACVKHRFSELRRCWRRSTPAGHIFASARLIAAGRRARPTALVRRFYVASFGLRRGHGSYQPHILVRSSPNKAAFYCREIVFL